MAQLVEVTDAAVLAEIRELFQEYARTVEEPACFREFARELDGLPGEYAPPAGRLLLAYERDGAAGCVGLRRLDPATAELKRLYVRPAYRSLGIGRSLAEAAITAARSRGYSRLVLDSLPKMGPAIALYYRLGFRRIEPYLSEPTPGSLCFELPLPGSQAP